MTDRKLNPWTAPTCVALLALLPGCPECDCDSKPEYGICASVCNSVAETGDYDDGEVDHGNLLCTFAGVCLLDLAPEDPVVQEAIVLGMVKPYTYEGSCPKPVRIWQTLGWYFPTVSSFVDDDDLLPHAAYCPSMDNSGGYTGPVGLSEPVKAFALCWPEHSAWLALWEQGAVARPTGAGSDCASLAPYGGDKEWSFEFTCPAGDYCMGLDEECACRCPEGDDTTCSHVQQAAEAKYDVDFDDELICEGYPLRDKGSGIYDATSCVWNVGTGLPAPPLGRPWHKLDASKSIACVGDRASRVTCSVGPELRDVMASDGYELLRTGVAWHMEDATTLALDEVERSSVAGLLELQSGDWIQGVDDATLSEAVAFVNGEEALTLEVVSEAGAPFVLELLPL